MILNITKPVFSPRLRTVSRTELYSADELFLTSSNKEVLPVSQVDDVVIGTGKPGPVTKKIRGLFRAYTDQYAKEARVTS